jgi:WD40 repeat protein
MADSKYKIQEFVAHSTRVNCLSLGPKSNQVLATGGEDCKVNIWRVGNVSNIWTLGHNKASIECLCFDSEEQCVVSGADNGSLKVFDLNVGKLARSLGTHPARVTSVQYHPYGEFVVSGSVDNTMKVWDVRAKSCIQTYNGHSKELTCVRFSPDGKWVASSAKDGQIQFWDLVAGKLVNSIKFQPAPHTVKTFEFSPADFTLAAVTSMRTVRFWELEKMDIIGNTTSDPTPIQAIAYSSLGTELYTASKDTLRLWDLDPELSMRATVETGWEKIDDMKISNNYQLVAASCLSNFVSIWSIDVQEVMEQESAHYEERSSADVVRDRFSGKYPAVSGAKSVENSPAPTPSGQAGRNQAQLNDVRSKLSQLSADLGFGAQEKAAPPSVTGGGKQDVWFVLLLHRVARLCLRVWLADGTRVRRASCCTLCACSRFCCLLAVLFNALMFTVSLHCR